MHSFWWQPFARSILVWWAALVLLGWLVFPLVHRAFVFLPDRGLLVSKLVAIVLLGFGRAWLTLVSARVPVLAGHEGAVALDILIVLNLLLFARHYRTVVDFLRSNLGRILRIEAAFAALYLLYLWFRSYVADATFDALGWFGAEKWGNLAILTSIWRNPSIPPADPWLAGYPLNYYWFSHWVWATLAHTTGTAPEVAFNLALATLFALLIQVSFAAGRVLSERSSGGWWAVFLVALAGTPATWSQAPEFVRAWRDAGIGAALRDFSFWAPSDVLPNTRNEFPAFNYLLGDLHAHSFGLLLLLAALCLAANLQRVREASAAGWAALAAVQGTASGLLLVLMASMWATNSWDVAVAALVGLAWVMTESCREGGLFAKSGDWGRLVGQGTQGLLLWVLALLVSVFLAARFYSAYSEMPLTTIHDERLAHLPAILGVLGYIGWVAPLDRTTPGQWFGYWGVAALAIVGVAVGRIGRDRAKASCELRVGSYELTSASSARLSSPKSVEPRVAGCEAEADAGRSFFDSPTTAAAAVGVAILALASHSTHRLPAVALTLIWVLIALKAGVLSATSRWRLETHAQWAFILLSCALLCQIVPEFFYVDDPIGAPNERYNTVFKLYYSAWALAGLAAAILLSYALAQPALAPIRLRIVLFVLSVLFVLFAGVYPVLGVAGRIARGRQRLESHLAQGLEPQRARRACRTLDGLAFMDLPAYAPDDLRLGLWMRGHLPESAERIAEAPGESYTMTARFAVISGVPSFLGWGGHETQWRGDSFDRIYSERSQALKTLYTTPDADRALQVCRANGLKWVAVGKLERERYGAQALAKFDRMGQAVQRFGDSVLYLVPLGSEDRESHTETHRKREQR